MKKQRIISPAAIALPLFALAVPPPVAGFDWSATGALATDYVQRGVSQTRGEPVVQGAVNVSHPAGLWVGVFASNVEFIDERFMFDDGADLELDYSIGFGRALSETWAVDGSLTLYRYPGARSFVDYDYRLLRLDVDYRGWAGASIAWSDDYSGYYKGGYADNDRAVFYEVAAERPVAGSVSWNAALGHADVDRVVGTNYRYWRLGLSLETGRVVVDAAWFASDSDARRLYGDTEAGSRFVVAVSMTVP